MKCPHCDKNITYIREVCSGGWKCNRLNLNEDGKITHVSVENEGNFEEVFCECPECREPLALPEWAENEGIYTFTLNRKFEIEAESESEAREELAWQLGKMFDLSDWISLKV